MSEIPSTKRLNGFQEVARLWAWLLHTPYQVPQRIWQGRFLAASLLFAITFSIYALLLPLSESFKPFGENYTLCLALSMCGFLVAYALNRHGYYSVATNVTLLNFSLNTFLAAIIGGYEMQSLFLIYLLIPILLSSVLVSFAQAVIVYALIMAGFCGLLLSTLGEQSLTPHIAMIVGIVGMITLLMIYYRNNVEQIRQSNLIESEERYRSLVEVCPDAIVVVAEGKFVYVNPSAITLFGAHSADDLLGKYAIEFIDPAYRRDVSESLLRPRDDRPLEQRITRLDGVARAVEVIGSAILYEGKRARQSVIRDITERQRAHQQAMELTLEREKIRLLEQFISDTSHDLRTPISTLSTVAYLFEKLSDKISEQAHHHNAPDQQALERSLQQLRERAQSLRSTVQRLARIVEGMFDMARLDGLTAFTLTRLDLNSVVKRTLEPYLADATQLGCTLTLTLSNDNPHAFLNEMEFSRVLQNLVENALQYTPNGGTVTMRTYVANQEAVFEVRDSGIGIAVDELPHIFERFYRTDKARSTHTGGAGLGLAITKKIVEAHRGRITVASQPDQGTTFCVYLPLVGQAPLTG
ncbi:MAG: PAS domain S-box protein [Chloroflexi bacterium CFX4]|nr:PAS domain S-box protein [Chloroflexi bacterium CFX4]MDL1922401.1 PAS domain S-box protein [Chloroflexi bacterium CFX3]